MQPKPYYSPCSVAKNPVLQSIPIFRAFISFHNIIVLSQCHISMAQLDVSYYNIVQYGWISYWQRNRYQITTEIRHFDLWPARHSVCSELPNKKILKKRHEKMAGNVKGSVCSTCVLICICSLFYAIDTWNAFPTFLLVCVLYSIQYTVYARNKLLLLILLIV